MASIEDTIAGRTLLDSLADNADRYPDQPALRTRTATLSWREYRERVLVAARGFVEAGVRPGDRVGILMSNRPELAIADFALLHARAVPVCLFDSFTAEQTGAVLRNLDIGLTVTDDTDWAGLMAAGEASRVELEPASPDDLVSINYTSGTTGGLKGVRHSHRNVLWHAESFARFLPTAPGTRFLSYLPRAHATERFVTTWYPLTRAGTVHLCPDPARLPEYLRDVRPQFFGGVLRVWEKLYAAGARSAADLGLDGCGFAFSGGGALAVHVQEYFHALGVPLAEGWGQSELVSAATCARPDRIRAGTVGPPLPGVEVRVAPDGELLVRSGSQMVGYTNAAANVDADGWLRTGDLGEIDEDGYVRILGRREEVFRLADGYPVPVTRVESALRANALVDQAYVFGEGQPDLSAILVAPNTDLDEVVRDANRHLPERLRIARYAVLAGQWIPGQAEELTHTGKLKRGLIAAKYTDLIKSIR